MNILIAWYCAIVIDIASTEHRSVIRSSRSVRASVVRHQALYDDDTLSGQERFGTITAETSIVHERAGAMRVFFSPLDHLAHDKFQVSSWLAILVDDWGIANVIDSDHAWTELATMANGPQCAFIDARGWPALSFMARFDYVATNDPDTVVCRSGVMVRASTPNAKPWIRNKALPLKPMWFGACVNVLFYSVIGMLISTFARAVRRMNRLRRGRCTNCAYDLRVCLSSRCPECGAVARSRIR